MKVVLTHIGNSTLPFFLEYCFYQYRLFNTDIETIFLVNNLNLKNDIFQKYNIKPYPIEDYPNTKINEFFKYYNYDKENFWTVTTTRLFYIESFLEKEGIEDVYHFENDVLIYHDIKENHYLTKQTFKNIAITTGGPDKNMTGFMYIKNYNSIKMMNDFFIDSLKKLQITGLIRKYGMDMVHEMSLMKVYDIETDSDKMDNFPSLHVGESSKHLNIFNSFYDPATWGQYIGGTNTRGPGATPQDHYIGKWLKNNNNWVVDFEIVGGKKIPYFKIKNNIYKINNLHIHSKQLKKYISK